MATSSMPSVVDDYPLFSHMPTFHKIMFRIIHFLDRRFPWYKLPVFLGLAYLEMRRTLHQHYNLLNVGPQCFHMRSYPKEFPYRTEDGKFDDPFDADAGHGSQGALFGRNMNPTSAHAKQESLLDPHPSVVATKLLSRIALKDTGTQFNMLAASWIQFMIHDWVDHMEDTEQVVITAPQSIAGECPLKSFKFLRFKEVAAGSNNIKTGYLNIRTPWWDGSAIYGNNATKLEKVRTFEDGKLKLGSNGLLLQTSDGEIVTGDVRNGFAGLYVLQALFMKEHNAICDQLKKFHPHFDDQTLYRHARLVTSAVIAKIHTIDWTVELLKMDTLRAGMQSNWYGLLGKTFKQWFGHTGSSILSGYIGMPQPDNHGVPYSLTEEFVSVYRMHSLLPDSIDVRNIAARPGRDKTPPQENSVAMPELVGRKGLAALSRIGNETMIASMGHQACAALTLFNYPVWMRDLVPQDPDGKDRADHVDLPALEVYRDRERSVARYNQFRRNMLMVPITKWEDLTDDKEARAALQEVYGDDVEKLDLLPGMMAERKIKGFAISETAFFIFLVMATRRLEADRFFTSDFNEQIYSKEGLEWVNSTESLKDVLRRHHRELVEKWGRSSSAFSVWSAEAQGPGSCIPLYLRIPSSN